MRGRAREAEGKNEAPLLCQESTIHKALGTGQEMGLSAATEVSAAGSYPKRKKEKKRTSVPVSSPKERVASGFLILFSSNQPWSYVPVKICTQQVVTLKENYF